MSLNFISIPGLPVTIRLLDPPLHEFLPEGDLEQIVSELTSETGTTEDEVFSRIEKLSESESHAWFPRLQVNIPFYYLSNRNFDSKNV